jgi:RNA polymerase sigma factor for flagellar operon FliA
MDGIWSCVLSSARFPEQAAVNTGAEIVAGDEVAALWQALGSGDTVARTALVQRHMPFARTLAAKMYAGRTHREMEFDDYLQYARVGLMEAVDRFDPSRGFKFETYAGSRINGAILDGMRSFTEIQQQIYARKQIVATRVDILQDTAPDGSDASALFAYLAELAIGLAVGFTLEDTGMYRDENSNYEDNTYAGLEMRQLRERVRQLVGVLPEKQRQVISYHYLQQRPFEEIADMLGLTRGRIAQLHKEALGRLRDAVREHHHLNLSI